MNKPTARILLFFHDRDAAHLPLLEAHFHSLVTEGIAEFWHRGKVAPGEPVIKTFNERLETAHIVLLLISADFNADLDQPTIAAIQALGAVRVVPIALRPCTWAGMPFYGLQPLPKDGDPLVADGRIHESRVKAVVEDLRMLVGQCQATGGLNKSITAADPVLVETLASLERERASLLRALAEERSAAATTIPDFDQAAHTLPDEPSSHLLPSESPPLQARVASSQPNSKPLIASVSDANESRAAASVSQRDPRKASAPDSRTPDIVLSTRSLSNRRADPLRSRAEPQPILTGPVKVVALVLYHAVLFVLFVGFTRLLHSTPTRPPETQLTSLGTGSATSSSSVIQDKSAPPSAAQTPYELDLKPARERATECIPRTAEKTHTLVRVILEPTGEVNAVLPPSSPFSNTPTEACIGAAFRASRVPSFSGPPVLHTMFIFRSERRPSTVQW